MKLRQAFLAIQLICVSTALPSLAQTNNQNNPTVVVQIAVPRKSSASKQSRSDDIRGWCERGRVQ